MWEYLLNGWSPGTTGDHMIRLKVIPLAPTGVAEQPVKQYSTIGLGLITPNPMMTQTTINFQLITEQHVSLSIYDIAGKLVRTLITGHQQAGSHEVTWDSKDTRGKHVASGVYFVKLEAGDNTATEKLLLIK